MLKCHNITFRYDQSSKGLSNVTFSTDKAKIIGVVGENGAGKSTFFKCLLGLQKPSEGYITYQGARIDYSKKGLIALRKRVNMVLQDPERQIFYNTVYDEVAMGPRNLGLSPSEVDGITNACIETVEGNAFSEMPIQYLSFGQKKRVAIAGILALNCDVILMDEPETGLDPMMRNALMLLIKKLASEGKKIIIASHNMDLIYMMCDYVYVFQNGSVLSEGTPDKVMGDEDLMKKAHLEVPLRIQLTKKTH